MESITKMNLIQQLIIFNGIYDILCALCILNKIHLSMFINEPKEQNKKYLAYWVFINGYIRFLAGIYMFYKINKYLVSITYIIEARVIANECFIHKTIKPFNGIIVSIMSLILAILVLI